MVNIDDYFMYMPKYPIYYKTAMIPKLEYDGVLQTCIGSCKYDAEHQAMIHLWNNRDRLNLNINHRFQIQGNFNKELK